MKLVQSSEVCVFNLGDLEVIYKLQLNWFRVETKRDEDREGKERKGKRTYDLIKESVEYVVYEFLIYYI
jgi:hypothetical protein